MSMKFSWSAVRGSRKNRLSLTVENDPFHIPDPDAGQRITVLQLAGVMHSTECALVYLLIPSVL